MPRWQQSKKRGFFEFLIPHPERVEVRALVRLLGENKMNYRVEVRIHNPKTRKTRTSITVPPVLQKSASHPKNETYFPLSVGAESSCEALLPFLPDAEVESAHGDRIAWPGDYMKEDMDGVPRAPLLHWSSWAVIRVEAAHWVYIELDHYVLGAVQDSGMEVQWKGKVCEKKAVEEIGSCGLEL